MSTIIHPTFAPGSTEPLVQRAWWGYLLWVPAAALLGFAIAEIFAGLLHLPRSVYLIPYVALVSLALYAFLHWSGLSLTELFRHNWVWGVVGAVLVGAFVVRNVLSQPASARAEGLPLAFELLWSGVVYGLIEYRKKHAIFSRMICRIPGWKWDSTCEEFLELARTLRGVAFGPKKFDGTAFSHFKMGM